MGSHSHSHSKDKDREKDKKSHRKHHKDDDDSNSRHKKHRSSHHHSSDDGDEWVEKKEPPTSSTSSSKPPIDTYSTFTPGASSSIRDSRDGSQISLQPLAKEGLTDGYGDGEDGSSKMGTFGLGDDESGERDLFGLMGVERKRKEPKEKLDPTQTMGQSSRELNKSHWQGTAPPLPSPIASLPPTPGSTGSSWRLAKIRRTYETAEEEGRTVEDVALQRYGSIENWEEALEEKRVLDERRGGGGYQRSGTPSGGGGGRFIFNDPGSAGNSRPPSRAGSFRRPGEALERTSSTNSTQGTNSRPSTPVPSVFTPPTSRTPRLVPPHPSGLSKSMVVDDSSSTTTTGEEKPVLDQSQLNKLQAKVLKARLMGDDGADELEAEYELERKRSLEGGGGKKEDKVEMVPTIDGRGRLYDIGTGKEQEDESMPGKRKKKEKAFESHDLSGNLIRHNPDDDSLSLSELVRQERFSAGAQDQKSMDFEIASRIAGDTKFQNDLDYVDDHAEVLARKKMKSEVLKKAFAVQDYAKTKKALDNCTLCYTDEGQPPKAPVVALGTRAYLALLENEELVPGHCRIVPIQHHFSSLEADEETWDEIKNFMKTLMQMFAERDQGVVFFESCISLKNQKHTWIEAIPVSFDLFDEIPAYFKEAIDNSEQEWSQHKKRIIFTSSRPFRRALVPNLPYFAIQWDYKGEKGYGHIIEGVDDAPDRDADGEEQRGEMGEKGAGEFPRWFATEIIGSVLEIEPRKWRKPRRINFSQNSQRVEDFRKSGYDKFDWTKMLRTASSTSTSSTSKTTLKAVKKEEEFNEKPPVEEQSSASESGSIGALTANETPPTRSSSPNLRILQATTLPFIPSSFELPAPYIPTPLPGAFSTGSDDDSYDFQQQHSIPPPSPIWKRALARQVRIGKGRKDTGKGSEDQSTTSTSSSPPRSPALKQSAIWTPPKNHPIRMTSSSPISTPNNDGSELPLPQTPSGEQSLPSAERRIASDDWSIAPLFTPTQSPQSLNGTSAATIITTTTTITGSTETLPIKPLPVSVEFLRKLERGESVEFVPQIKTSNSWKETAEDGDYEEESDVYEDESSVDIILEQDRGSIEVKDSSGGVEVDNEGKASSSGTVGETDFGANLEIPPFEGVRSRSTSPPSTRPSSAARAVTPNGTSNHLQPPLLKQKLSNEAGNGRIQLPVKPASSAPNSPPKKMSSLAPGSQSTGFVYSPLVAAYTPNQQQQAQQHLFPSFNPNQQQWAFSTPLYPYPPFQPLNPAQSYQQPPATQPSRSRSPYAEPIFPHLELGFNNHFNPYANSQQNSIGGGGGVNVDNVFSALGECEAKLKAEENEVAKLKEMLKNGESLFNKLKIQSEEHKLQVKKAEAQHAETKKRLSEAVTRLVSLENELENVLTNRDSAVVNHRQTEEELQKLYAKFDEMLQKQVKNTRELSEATSNVSKLQGELHVARKNLCQEEAKRGPVGEERRAALLDVKKITVEKVEVDGKLSKTESELQHVRSHVEELLREMAEAKQSREVTSKIEEDHQKSLNRLKRAEDRIRLLETQCETTLKDLALANGREHSAGRELNDLLGTLELLQTENKSLKAAESGTVLRLRQELEVVRGLAANLSRQCRDHAEKKKATAKDYAALLQEFKKAGSSAST